MTAATTYTLHLLVVVALLATLAAASTHPLAYSWMGPTDPVSQRVEALLSQMTIEEKLWQLARPEYSAALDATGVGLLEFQALYANAHNATQVVQNRNAAQRGILSAGPGARLGIPAAFRLFSIHGAEAYGTTFPEGPGMAASWDVDLMRDSAAAIAAEGRALGADMAFYVINLWSDARFGRQQEGVSEDPMLTAAFTEAMVEGSQGALNLAPDAYLENTTTTLAALFKHVGAYAAAAGGMNGGRADKTELTVRDVYLKPWRRAAAVGARGLMPSHNTVLNVPAHGSPWLMRSTLRGEYNWSMGLFVSDTGDVQALGDFRVCGDAAACAARALYSGVDIEQVPGALFQHLPEAVARGLVTQGDVDNAVRRVLNHKFSLRLFDAPYTDESLAVSAINTPAHRALAQRAAEESLVLLLNRGGVLPLSPTAPTKIAVVGPNAGCGDGGSGAGTVPLCSAQAAMMGNYVENDADVPPTGVPTVVEALRAATSAASITFNRGCNIDDASPALLPAALAAARASDVIVAVLGDSTRSSGESEDRDDLDLPGGQMPLLTALAALGKPLIVVLIHGRTVTFGASDGNKLLSNISGLVVAWRPGQAGGTAVARALTGAVNPSGRLPNSWVRAVGQSNGPASPWLQERASIWGGPTTGAEKRRYGSYVGSANAATPLFSFGEGLSYTSFSLTGLQASVNMSSSDALVTASATVRNTGARDGAVVVQAYVQDPVGATLHVRPWKRLVAFTRLVNVAAGATAPVLLAIKLDDLAYHGDDGALALHAGQYILSIGLSSVDDEANTLPFVIPAPPAGANAFDAQGAQRASASWRVDPLGRRLVV